MKILRQFRQLYGTATSKILNISKPTKLPQENYMEPEKWDLKFEKPSQVRPRAFVEENSIEDANIGKEEPSVYKNPEYFSYHPMSYYNMEEDLHCKRCKPQPSPYWRVLFCNTKTNRSP